MLPKTRNTEPLFSEFADDSEMMELVELFVEEMGDRIATLERSWNDGALDELRTISHQLKGASGGYGFPTITDAAAELEQQLRAGGTDKQSLSESFEQLLTLCKRASA